MTYSTLKEFYGDWTYESDAMQKVLNNLTDESLNQKVTPTGRSLGFLGWHNTETIGEMLGRTGLKVFIPDMANYNTASAKDLQECYKNASGSLVEKLKASWMDD